MMKIFTTLILLATAACATLPLYTAPVLPEDLSFKNVAGSTICSLNNLPVALVDHNEWQTIKREFIIVHEQVHASDMYNYKGGCWAFFYRYNEDKAFALNAEYKAYCIEGKFAVSRNADPRSVWIRIQTALAEIDSVRSKKMPNCIY